jgi:rhodanese-related sulfurtransferase
MPPEAPATVNAIDAAALAVRLAAADAHALIDVREPGEAERGHILGATCVPRRLIEFRLFELVRDRATAITVCDDDTGRAALAAATLVRLGYRNVAFLRGGIAAWKAAGHRLATGTNVPSKRYGEAVEGEHDVPRVTASELHEWGREGRDVVICDVRTPEEYTEACIPGAYSAPGFDYALHAADLARTHGTVVMNCAGRTRSIIATRTLIEMGHANVVGLENGTMGWRLAGLDVEKGAARELAAPSAQSVAEAAAAARALADAAGIARVDAATLMRERHDETARAAQGRARNGYLFDVRRVAEYLRGHIPGALALPGGQAVQRADDFIALRTAPIVLVDERDVQACLAAVWLHRMGIRDVRVLAGGIDAWKAAGGAMATGRERAEPLGWAEAVANATPQPVQECAALLRERPDTLIVDVGTSRSYRRGHLQGATWLPRGWLEARIDALAGSHARPLLVACDDGRQSVYAAATLRALGYTDVRALEGGKRAWQQAGLPLVPGPLPPQDDELVPPYKRGEQGMRDYLAWERQLVEPVARPAQAPT